MCMALACKGNPEVACVVEVGHALAIADDFNTRRINVLMPNMGQMESVFVKGCMLKHAAFCWAQAITRPYSKFSMPELRYAHRHS